ncbi:toprim domain-containing protein [Streptomyces lydicus]|uniref:toprim domain-containing protein n=1 Tax=Streptomyces lydicus TaxID=47763 RepID=UPI0033E030CC
MAPPDSAAVSTDTGAIEEPAERPDTEAQPSASGRDAEPSTEKEPARTYQAHEEVVTPSGTGYVIGQGPEGILVNEGGTYELYQVEQLSRPGEERAPEPVDLAEDERQARKLGAAMSPEGLELRGDNARLAHLNLDEGHGEVLNTSGVLIGWIRRRGRTWYGQDARGGIRSSTRWTEDSKGGPLRAAELMAGVVAMGADRDTMFGGEPFRHIRPEEVTAPIFYSDLTDAQTRELRTLAEQWKTSADPDLRTAAAQWSQEISTFHMRRLAEAVEDVAAHTSTRTPQGRRRQGVLQRLAVNIRSQAHTAEGAFSTLPRPGEPDPWAQPYRPEGAPTSNAPLDTPARPETAPPAASKLLGTATAGGRSEGDAVQPEEPAAPQAAPGVPTPSHAPLSGDEGAAATPSSEPTTPGQNTQRITPAVPRTDNEKTGRTVFDRSKPRFKNVAELREHLRQGNLDEPGPTGNGIVRSQIDEILSTTKLELSPGGRLALAHFKHHTGGRRWRILTPGAMEILFEPNGITHEQAIAYTEALEGIRDRNGQPFPWDAPDAVQRAHAFRGPDGEILGVAVAKALLGHLDAGGALHHSDRYRARKVLEAEEFLDQNYAQWRAAQEADGYTIPVYSPADLQAGDEISSIHRYGDRQTLQSQRGTATKDGASHISAGAVGSGIDFPLGILGDYTASTDGKGGIYDLDGNQTGRLVSFGNPVRLVNDPGRARTMRRPRPSETQSASTSSSAPKRDITPTEPEQPSAQTHTQSTTPLAEAEEALAVAETIRSHRQSSSTTTSALLHVQGGGDRVESLASEAGPERAGPRNRPGKSSEPPASEDENEYGRGRYVPWGWSVSQGMARAIDEAKVRPRGLSDPPVFSEAVPSKVKTADLTEPQLIRRLLSLDEYLARWRAVEPVDAPRTKKARDGYAKRVYSLVHRYQDVLEEFDDRRAQRRNIARGRRPGPGEVLFGELVAGDRVLVKVHGQEEPVPCTVKRRSPEGYGVVGLDTTEDYRYENRYMPVRRADATQINDRRDDNRFLSYLEEEYGLLQRWLVRHPRGAEGREGIRARAVHLTSLITSDPKFSGTLPLLPAAEAETKQPAQPSPSAMQPGAQEQTALFAFPTADPAPASDDPHATATEETTSATDESLPRYSKARQQILDEILRGNITEADGVFMQRVPRRFVRPASSPQRISAVLDEGLAERAGEQIQLSERGINWYAHHNLPLPQVPRGVEAVEQAPLPPIDYVPLGALPVPGSEGPRPPAPAPLPDDWYVISAEGRSEESVQATYDMADDAAQRAAHSTARDLAEIAAGPDHRYWTHQYPLAQYDENAAAALEAVTDPVTHGYATQAVLHLRTALEEAGKKATDHYVQNVRSPQWQTQMGSQADDIHQERVRGIVITYLIAVREDAEEHGLDADTIANVLEDAAGWTGELRELSNKPVKFPHLPAAESVAEAAQHVANELRAYALGQTDTVDTRADRRKTWRTIDPRPAPAELTSAAERGREGADGVLTGGEAPPGQDASPTEKIRFERRFDLAYRVGQFVDHHDDRGEVVTSRVVSDGINPILRDDNGHEFRALSEFRQSRFLHVREDDGSVLPPPAWTATLPDGFRAVAPDQVKPGDVVHDYLENGGLWTSRLVIEVQENNGKTALTTVGLQKHSGVWLHYDHRVTAVLDETEQSRQLAEAALRRHEVRKFAKIFGISLKGVHVRPATEAATPPSPPVQKDPQPDQSAARPDDAAASEAPPTNNPTAAEAGASTRATDDAAHTQQVHRQDPVQGQATHALPGSDEQTVEQPTEPPTTDPPGITPASPGPVPDNTVRGASPDTSALLAEATPAPTGRDEEPRTKSYAPAAEAATAEPGDRPERATPEHGSSPRPRPPAAVREEGTVATSARPGVAAVEEPAASDQAVPQEAQWGPESAVPYLDAAAYAAAHEALLSELDQHEGWLAATPAAAEAADALNAADTQSLALTALLSLHAANSSTADSDRRTRLTQRLGHHLRCTQLTVAKDVLARAARITSIDQLRDLHHDAFDGQFIALLLHTEDGEMEVGHYLEHRAEQIAQQAARSEAPSEAEPATAQETATMAVDPDDDSQLPIFELPGEPLFTFGEAAPRLLAHARSLLASGFSNVKPFAHIHGRPVYAAVHQPEGSAEPLLLFGLAETSDGARTVHINAGSLSAVAPEELLAAVTTWMNADDIGDLPLLDYGSAARRTLASAPEPGADLSTTAKPQQPEPPDTPTETAATADTREPPATPAPEAIAHQTPQPPAGQQAPTPANTPPAPTTEAEAAAQDVGDNTLAPASNDPEDPTTLATSTKTSPDQIDPAARQDNTRQEQQASLSAAAPTTTSPVDQITALARATLAARGITLDATGVLTAPGTVVITLATSGSPERDRELADSLRIALNEVIREHPDRQLAAYRIDFQHTSQPGQESLQSAESVQATPVPRERLIAVNDAAATIFAERLQSDPNAELARTYLTEERQLPAEVQQEWGVGYAPSDRSATPKRWDVLCQELRRQGFSEEELLQAGLARRSSIGRLYDYFDDRIVFPIHDEQGDVVGFGGRRIDRPGETKKQTEERQSSKYLNTPETRLFKKRRLVFGLHHPAQAQALAEGKGPCVSVEGYLDVIAVARAAANLPLDQRPVVGAPMGTAFTEHQLAVLRALNTDNPRPHIAFLDNDDSGRQVLLDKWDLLLHTHGPTAVTTAPDAKDAAKLWEEGVESDGDGATLVLSALEQYQPLLDAAVEAALMKTADEVERANHAFDPEKSFNRTRGVAAEAARYIHEAVRLQSPGNTAALEQAAVSWAKRLHQAWSIPGHMTASAVLLGPGNHGDDYENEVYEHALDLLAADPEGYFTNDSHVRSRASAAEDTPTARTPAEDTASATDIRPAAPGQWPAGTSASGPMASPSSESEPASAPGDLALSMFLPGAVDGQMAEHTDRTTAAYALHTAVWDRLGQHTTETPEPDRLPAPQKLGTVHGIDLSTSGDDQPSDDPTVVLWLGPSRNDSLRLSYNRFRQMSAPDLLAAVEWRAAQAAGLLGTPLSQTWRDAVRSIIPSAFPARPTPQQLSALLNTIAQGADGSDVRIRRRAEQAVAMYTVGHADLALDHLADTDHIWVLRNDGSWVQEEAPAAEQTWEELEAGFSQESEEIRRVTEAAALLPEGDPPTSPSPLAVDLTVAHRSAHEAVQALRPYSTGLPGVAYERITDLVAQMDGAQAPVRRLHGPDGERLLSRARASFVRVLEGLATVAAKVRLKALSTRLERTVARLRGQAPATLPAPRPLRIDRRMQDLDHIARDLEKRMATTPVGKLGELQVQWIINLARQRDRYEQLHGEPMSTEFLPDNGLIAGAPPIPNPSAAHELLLDHLRTRIATLRDTDPHTGEDGNPYDPTADLLTGVAWAYQQRLVGAVPTGPDPEGPIPAAQLRQAALIVTSHQDASPLILRRAMDGKVSAERADRLLQRLEDHQILGPYRSDAPRTVLAQPADIDAMLSRPPSPPAPRTKQPSASKPAPKPPTGGPQPTDLTTGELDARVQQVVNKLLADQQERSTAGSRADSAEPTAAHPPRSRKGKTALKEAEANALAAGQPTSLAPSQP